MALPVSEATLLSRTEIESNQVRRRLQQVAVRVDHRARAVIGLSAVTLQDAWAVAVQVQTTCVASDSVQRRRSLRPAESVERATSNSEPPPVNGLRGL